MYTTIDGENQFELEEKRSLFIGYAKNVTREEEARAFIAQIKSKHHDARHNCSAYLLRNGQMRYSDDGEPQGTAGIPMLEVIKKSGYVDVVVVVTRYFGGILLGAGGLVRAYSAACAGVLTSATPANHQKCSLFSCELDYPLYDKFSRHMANYGARAIEVSYNEKIVYEGVIPSSEFNVLKNSVTEQFSGKLEIVHIDDIFERV